MRVRHDGVADVRVVLSVVCSLRLAEFSRVLQNSSYRTAKDLQNSSYRTAKIFKTVPTGLLHVDPTLL